MAVSIDWGPLCGRPHNGRRGTGLHEMRGELPSSVITRPECS